MEIALLSVGTSQLRISAATCGNLNRVDSSASLGGSLMIKLISSANTSGFVKLKNRGKSGFACQADTHGPVLMGYLQFDELFVLDFALLDDVFFLEDVDEADVFLVHEGLHLRRRHGVVLPEHGGGGYFARLGAQSHIRMMSNPVSGRQKELAT